MTALAIADHPLLELGAFVAHYPAPLAELPVPPWLQAGPSPLSPPDDGVRKAVRELLRHGGFKPSGRSKPASEFLLRAASEGALGSINLAVDLCNVASLHAGLPISVVDLDRLEPPLRVGLAGPETRYVFNPSGQEIRVDGLLCLFDGRGPCAGPVKDSQRTKTDGATRRTLCLVWGCASLGERTAATLAWYRALHQRAGAELLECAKRP